MTHKLVTNKKQLQKENLPAVVIPAAGRSNTK